MKLLHDQYEIRIKLRWELKDGLKERVPCPKCSGREPNSLLDDHHYGDQPNNCSTCCGIGKIRNPELKPKPTFSNDLRDHLSEAFNDFMDAFEDEEVK